MTIRQLTAPHSVLLEEPQNGVPQTSEMIRGERFRILEERDGWLRAENAFDGHVGWLPPGTAHQEPVASTHRVRALRADLHPGPTHRAPPVATLSFGSLVTLDGRAENGWVGTDDGLWLFAGWLEPVDAPPATDHLATALRFLETPYVWGGRSSFGIDCSGLALTAMAAAGVVSHHSSGMQRKDDRLGAWVSDDGRDVEYRRGDIVFFPGHDGDQYFCLESKRLNARVKGVMKSLADEYVKEGMQRFVDGKYGRHVHHGGMLGYVLDGDVPRAMRNVLANIRARHVALGMEAPGDWTESTARPGDASAKESTHRRDHTAAEFRLHHQFLSKAGSPVTDKTASRPTTKRRGRAGKKGLDP